jgi:carboxyl-terminal processing protease
VCSAGKRICAAVVAVVCLAASGTATASRKTSGRRRTTTRTPTTRVVATVPSTTSVVVSTTTLPTVVPGINPHAYVNAVFDHIERASIRRRIVDVASLRAKTLAATADAGDTKATYPAIREALLALGDPHAGFYDPNQARALLQGSATGFGVQIVGGSVLFVVPGGPADRSGVRDGDVLVDVDGRPYGPTKLSDLGTTVRFGLRRGADRVEVEVTKGPVTTSYLPKVRAIDDRLAVLELPGATGSKDAQSRFMKTAIDGISAIDSTTRCGWVLDLRRNTGGFPYVTLAAAAPILGDGIMGGSVDVDEIVTRWSFRDGAVLVGEKVVESTRAYHLIRSDAAVAVLTSSLTASAGERAAIAAIGRSATRSFGAPTVGLASSTLLQPFVDGSAVGVTTSFDVDRFGVTYPGPIKPDETVSIDWTRLGRTDDPVLVAASTWLRAQPACAP